MFCVSQSQSIEDAKNKKRKKTDVFPYSIFLPFLRCSGSSPAEFHNFSPVNWTLFLSAAKPTDQGEEGVVLLLLVVVVGGFGGTVFRSPMYNQNGCIQRKLFLKNGCIQRKLFFKMGVSRENFS